MDDSSGCRGTRSSSRSATTRSASTPRTYALKVGVHPSELIPRNIANFRRQLKRAGLMVDWTHELSTTDPALLQVDAVGLPAALQAGAGLQEAGGGQLVPERQDRAGQRAGHRRRVRAVRHAGRAAVPGAVVLPHHATTPARLLDNLDRLDWSETHEDGAAELDRPVRGRGDRVPRAGLDEYAGSATATRATGESRRRRSTSASSRRARTRSSARRTSCSRPSIRWSSADDADEQRADGRGVPRARGEAGPRHAEDEQGEDRRLHRRVRDQSGDRRADPDLDRRLRADGVRHRRDHGRARPRRARLRVRARCSICRSCASSAAEGERADTPLDAAFTENETGARW